MIKEDVYAEGNTPGNGVSGNEIDQEDPVPLDQEDVNEIIKEYLENNPASAEDDGQLIYLVCEFYNNMEVMSSGVMKLLTVQIVLLSLLIGAVVANGIFDHFIR